MLKNWKTTVLGALIGGLIAIEPLISNGGVDAKQLIMGFLVAALAAVSKDFNVSGDGK